MDDGKLHGVQPGPRRWVYEAEKPLPIVQLASVYRPRIQGRYTAEAAARMLIGAVSMAEIIHVAEQLRLTEREALRERRRLFHVRYGI